MSKQTRILFVDDEPYVLDGLRRMLRSRRAEWDMVFAGGGQEALDLMEEKSFDVIVSDMRMPGMSGEQLLSQVRSRFPGTVRIVLSGQADREAILEAVGPIHQFLQKPCDEATLRSTINRTIALDELFASADLKAMVTEMESLPGLPAIYRELMAKFRMPDISAKEIGETISRDVAMTAKILQLVNSAFFGMRRHVGSASAAVALLGLNMVRSLVVTMQVFSRVSPGKLRGFSQEKLLAHSSEVATMAKKIAAEQGLSKTDVEETYLAGLLHDVGKLVLADQRPAQFAAARTLARTEGIHPEEAERRTVGASHAQIGAYLLGLWGFDPPIVEATAFHHCPGRSHDRGFSALTAVHVANEIVRKCGDGDGKGEPNIDVEYLARLGLADRLAVWARACPCAA